MSKEIEFLPVGDSNEPTHEELLALWKKQQLANEVPEEVISAQLEPNVEVILPPIVEEEQTDGDVPVDDSYQPEPVFTFGAELGGEPLVESEDKKPTEEIVELVQPTKEEEVVIEEAVIDNPSSNTVTDPTGSDLSSKEPDSEVGIETTDEDDDDEDYGDEITTEPIVLSVEDAAAALHVDLVKNATLTIPFESKFPISEDQSAVLSVDPTEENKLGSVNILPAGSLENLQRLVGREFVRLHNNLTNNNEDAAEARMAFLSELSSYINGTSDRSSVREGMFNDPEAELRQGILNDGILYRTKELEVRNNGKKSVGERAVLKIIKQFGVGAKVHTHLPLSNIWVVFTPPLETDLAMFYNHFSRLKAMFGKKTMGFTFTNMSVVANKELFLFALNYVDTKMTSLDIEKEDLWNYMTSEDLNAFFWGFFSAVYIEGFLFRRPCLVDNGCGNLHEVNADPLSFVWVDNSKYTTVQKKLVAKNTPKSQTLEDYNTFQSEFNRNDFSTFTYRDSVFTIGFPTVAQYFDDGYRWIDDVSDKVQETLSKGSYLEEEESGLLNSYLITSKARNITHYIKSITIGDDVFEDREDIINMVAAVSGNRGFNKALNDAVVEFRRKAVTYAIGVPEYTCPCQKDKEDPAKEEVDADLPTVTAVIPLDAWNVFFLMCITKFHMAASELVED